MQWHSMLLGSTTLCCKPARRLETMYCVQGKDTATVLLAEIVKFHVHEGVAAKSPSGRTVVDPIKLKPISRLGGNTCDPSHCIGGLVNLDGNLDMAAALP